MSDTSRTLEVVLLPTSQTEQAKMKVYKFMASFTFNFHGFADIVHGEGQVPPEDSVSYVSCQDMNCIFGQLLLLKGSLHSWTKWLIFIPAALKDMMIPLPWYKKKAMALTRIPGNWHVNVKVQTRFSQWQCLEWSSGLPPKHLQPLQCCLVTNLQLCTALNTDLTKAGTYWFCVFGPRGDNRRRFIVIFLLFIVFILFFRHRGSQRRFWCCFCALWTDSTVSDSCYPGTLKLWQLPTPLVFLDIRNQSRHAHAPMGLSSKLNSAQHLKSLAALNFTSPSCYSEAGG